ncbi:MAG: trigger factor, partial [Bulleidia sp.]
EDKGDNDLLDQLLAKTEVEIPDVMVEDEVNNRINQIAAQVQQYGMKLESYLSMMGKTLDQLKKDYEEESRKTVKTRLALDAVAKAEKLEPTDAEIEKEFSDIAAQYGLSVDRVKAAISRAAVQDQLREDKAFRFVKKNANGAPEVKEPEAEAPAAEEGKDASAAE